MKLYTHPISTPALGVLMTANALGLEYEPHVVNLQTGEQQSPEYLAMNPHGKVPVMDDDGFILSESGAIMRYMARKEKSDLYASGLQERANIEKWMDFSAHHVRAPMSRIQFNRLVAPMIGQTPDEASIQTGLHLLGANLPVVEQALGETAFLCGAAVTLADLTLLSSLDSAEILKVDISPYPNLSKWRETLRNESFYTKIHTHFGQEIGL